MMNLIVAGANFSGENSKNKPNSISSGGWKNKEGHGEVYFYRATALANY
jgi:hypothetical protein